MATLKPGIIDGEIITAIHMEYEPGSEDPGRIFRSMAQMIDSMHALDTNLAAAISTRIQPVQLLQEIETGSLKTWIRTILKQLDDEALKALDWKPLVGQYIVKAKHRVLQWLGERDYIKEIEEIEPLEHDLFDLAKNTDVLQIPTYAPVPRRKILSTLGSISASMRELLPEDKVKVISHLDETTVNKGFRLSSEEIEDLLTTDIEKTENTLVLLVKKPDYLGVSMWELRHEGHTVEAKIMDAPWLKRFQKREIDIRPGDAIKAKVEIIVKRAADQSVVAVRYNVYKVLDVIHCDSSMQIPLLREDGSN